MKILVCIKQVPDTTKIKTDPKTATLIRAGVASILNPYDHFALETALDIKQKTGAEVTVLSMGPLQAKSVLRLALALGADKAFLLSDKNFGGSDTWATAYALSCAAKKTGPFDLVLCGQMAIDGDTAQTGTELSFHLSMPPITFCTEVSIFGSKLQAVRLTEEGTQIVESNLPCLVTMAMPRNYKAKYPSFEQIMRSKGGILGVLSAAAVGADISKIGLAGSPTRVARIFTPRVSQSGPVISLSPQDAAQKIFDILKHEQVIK